MNFLVLTKNYTNRIHHSLYIPLAFYPTQCTHKLSEPIIQSHLSQYYLNRFSFPHPVNLPNLFFQLAQFLHIISLLNFISQPSEQMFKFIIFFYFPHPVCGAYTTSKTYIRVRAHAHTHTLSCLVPKLNYFCNIDKLSSKDTRLDMGTLEQP